jgi:hypothetical protein
VSSLDVPAILMVPVSCCTDLAKSAWGPHDWHSGVMRCYVNRDWSHPHDCSRHPLLSG